MGRGHGVWGHCINVPHQSGTFITIDEPTPTHRYHPKPVDYLKAHPWPSTFCGMVQTYHGIVSL